MTKILSSIALLGLAIMPLTADYQMTLIDKDGLETNQCIKSYSFSNNLESLHKVSTGVSDVYSYEETLTNKVYLGKPVYRKVVPLDDFTVPRSGASVIKKSAPLTNVENIIALDYFTIRDWNGYRTVSSSVNSMQALFTSGSSYYQTAHFEADTKKLIATVKNNIVSFPLHYTDYRFIVEYTKTTDKINTSTNTFKSFVHYELSSSSNEEVFTKNLANTGVKFLKGFTYDKAIDSCVSDTLQ